MSPIASLLIASPVHNFLDHHVARKASLAEEVGGAKVVQGW